MNARTKGIVWYLIIAFGLAWSTWELAIRLGISVLSWQFTIFAIPGAFAPAIAAAIVRKWITHEGFADAGLSLQVRSWRYYLFAWLLPLIVAFAVTAEVITLGFAQPDFSLSRAVVNGAAGHDIARLSGIDLAIIPQLLLTAIVADTDFMGRRVRLARLSSTEVGHEESGTRCDIYRSHLGRLALAADPSRL